MQAHVYSPLDSSDGGGSSNIHNEKPHISTCCSPVLIRSIRMEYLLASMVSSSAELLSPAQSSSSSVSNVSTPITETFDESSYSLPQDPSTQDQHILVVGGLGYIGSHTTWELLKERYSVIIVDNLGNSFQNVFDRLQMLRNEHFKLQSQWPSLYFHQADYRDQQMMKAILSKYSRPSSIQGKTSGSSTILGVIHFAAYKSVAESVQHPLQYYSNNVGGLIDFCSLLSDFGIKTFVFSSSATVYGDVANNNGGRIPEEFCTHKPTTFVDSEGQKRTTIGGCTGLTNPYGRTKWMCEAILNDVAAADPEWTIFTLRYFNPIGCDPSGMLGEDPRSTPNNLMPVVVKVMTGELPVLNIFGTDWDTEDGTAIRDFIHVSDLARGHTAALAAAAASKHQSGFRTFNLGSGKGHSVLEVVAAMELASGKQISVQPMGRRDGDVGVCIAEPSKAEAELHWRTEMTLETCCQDICRFLGIVKPPKYNRRLAGAAPVPV